MTYATLMAHLDLSHTNAAVLRTVETLAAQFDARVIGIAACQPIQIVGSDGYIAGEAIAACEDEFVKELREAEATFRASFSYFRRPVEWRSTITGISLSDYVAREARSADLVITCVRPAVRFEHSKHVSIGDLVMRTGRPVLIVPDQGQEAKFDRIVIAWKDGREARRAAMDALPLLKRASHVSVIEIAPHGETASALNRVRDVAAWLLAHGVDAIAIIETSTEDDASHLENTLIEQRADLVVAGAYGHSRLREWAFGGVTKQLLSGSRLALLSH